MVIRSLVPQMPLRVPQKNAADAASAQKLLISQMVAPDVTDWPDSGQAAFGPDFRDISQTLKVGFGCLQSVRHLISFRAPWPSARSSTG
jgi:hypothetical protein